MLLGDVAGKGIGAALVMSSLHAACRALVRRVHAIEDVTGILNETFVETTGAGVFVTMLLMLVDPIGRRVHYIRAGHNPALMVSTDGKQAIFENGGASAGCGLFPDLKFRREISGIDSGWSWCCTPMESPRRKMTLASNSEWTASLRLSADPALLPRAASIPTFVLR